MSSLMDVFKGIDDNLRVTPDGEVLDASGEGVHEEGRPVDERGRLGQVGERPEVVQLLVVAPLMKETVQEK